MPFKLYARASSLTGRNTPIHAVRQVRCCAQLPGYGGGPGPEDLQPSKNGEAESTRETIDIDDAGAPGGRMAGSGPAPSAAAVEPYIKASTSTALSKNKDIAELKRQLLMATAGLDRGLSATKRQADDVQRVARALEDVAGAVKLSWVAGGRVRSTMDDLSGVWRLIYSSAFETGNLGGLRPGPQASLVPFTLGPVYQRIDAQTAFLDNIVELLFAASPVPLPFALDSPSLRASLRHTYSIADECRVRIVYESTFAELLSAEEPVRLFGRVVRLEPPALQRLLPEDLRAATFDVSYLDDTLRVTRGDRGELRIYWKDRDALGDLTDPDANTTFSSMG